MIDDWLIHQLSQKSSLIAVWCVLVPVSLASAFITQQVQYRSKYSTTSNKTYKIRTQSWSNTITIYDDDDVFVAGLGPRRRRRIDSHRSKSVARKLAPFAAIWASEGCLSQHTTVWVDLESWLHTEVICPFTHPSTNWARRIVTSLFETNGLSLSNLSQTATAAPT